MYGSTDGFPPALAMSDIEERSEREESLKLRITTVHVGEDLVLPKLHMQDFIGRKGEGEGEREGERF